MWTCPNCHEQIDDSFDVCWKCGTDRDGTPSAEFDVEPGDPRTHDPKADPHPPDEPAANDPKNDRIVELCAAANEVEAHALCALLEEAGIRWRIVGETLGNAAGGLPLGDTIAPRIWVREEDAARAREIIDEPPGEVDWPSSSLAEGDEPAEPDLAPDESGVPSTSHAGTRGLGRGLSLLGAACILLGAVLAWHDWRTVRRYTATAEAVAVQYQRLYAVDSRPTSALPVPRVSPAFSVWYEIQYAFVVNGKTYYSLDPHCPRFVSRVPIHYDPHDPAINIRGTLTSPWPVLIFALGIGAILLWVGYNLARTGRQVNSPQ
jgi:hypothetical protein